MLCKQVNPLGATLSERSKTYTSYFWYSSNSEGERLPSQCIEESAKHSALFFPSLCHWDVDMLSRMKPGATAYRKVAVRAGMLLRNVKRMTMNMKSRRRVLFSHEDAHLPAVAEPGAVGMLLRMQLHS